MANYLVVKGSNQTKSYALKTTHNSVPYLKVSNSYLDLTTNTISASYIGYATTTTSNCSYSRVALTAKGEQYVDYTISTMTSGAAFAYTKSSSSMSNWNKQLVTDAQNFVEETTKISGYSNRFLYISNSFSATGYYTASSTDSYTYYSNNVQTGTTITFSPVGGNSSTSSWLNVTSFTTSAKPNGNFSYSISSSGNIKFSKPKYDYYDRVGRTVSVAAKVASSYIRTLSTLSYYSMRSLFNISQTLDGDYGYDVICTDNASNVTYTTLATVTSSHSTYNQKWYLDPNENYTKATSSSDISNSYTLLSVTSFVQDIPLKLCININGQKYVPIV